MERRNLEGTPAQVGEVVDRPSAAGSAAGDEAAGSSRLHDVRIVRWERFLPRRFLRVLLVEPDDSTRQIVAALLRKCGYRVVAVADGMKAWETLKETHFNCDLVLTEVTTPAISGIGLLSKIMTNDLCKNLPVIMMSSSDSVGVVFNCMLKGAADFLVKPVRKNELRNLWQHVWRRRSAGSGENICENETHVEEKVALIPDNNIDGNRMCENVVHSPKTGESFKKSDSQSSCGQSGTQFRGEEVPHQIVNKSICAETDLDINNTIYEPETVARTPLLNLVDNVHSTSQAATEQPSQAASTSKENHTRCDQITSTEENVGSTSCKYAAPDPDHDTRTRNSEEVIDFIGGCREPHAFEEANYIDHRQRFSLGDEEHLDLSENAPSVATSPLCQTSLRNPCFGSSDKNEFHDNRILNHSDASAFSRYRHKGPHHVVKPHLASSSRLYIKGKDCHSDGGIVGSTSKEALRQSQLNEFESLKSSRSDGEKQSPCILIKETPVSGDSRTFSRKNEGMGYPNFQLGSLSVPIPVGAVSLDSMCTSYNAFLQPVYYSEAGLSLWHPCIEQNTNEKNEGEHICDCQSHCEYAHSTLHEQKTMGQDGGRDSLIAKPSTMVSSSVTNVIHRGIRSDLNENQNNGRSDEAVAAAAAENDDFDSENHENCNSSGVHHDHSTHREAALTKFRLKRKNRCFEKKVRYFSRQKLAEQRPRMKGQFVRQADFGSKDENSNI